ncbi:MAG TPA: tetratricopeptide repeat protein [Sedimentisphaerales bacterium]|nr:tetratricopeptide repeat protein [Sedimentisphaerales bacterium]
MDDALYITQNHHVLQGLSWEGIKWAFTAFHAANWHPVTWISHMLDVSLFGTWAGGHHLMGTALHIVNALLLFGFLRYTTRRFWPCIFVAAVFALHPLRVESVAWAAQRKDTLSVLFFFATIWTYAFYTRKPGLWRYLAVTVCYMLGLMSKSMLVTLPIVLLLLDYWPLGRMAFDGWKVNAGSIALRRIVLEKLPLFAMAAVVALITVLSQSGDFVVIPLSELDWPSRLTNTVFSYWRYIQNLFWPLNLAFGYPLAFRPLYAQAAASLLAISGITIAAFRLGARHRYLPVGWLWYAIVLVPVSGLMQTGIQSHADRYTYISTTGLLIMLAYGAADLAAARPALRQVFAVLAASALLILGTITRHNIGYWKDELTLYNRAIAVTKDNYFALTCRATALFNQGRLAEARADAEESLRIYPLLGRTHVVMCALLLAEGRPEEALEHCRIGVEVEHFAKDAQYNMALALLQLNQPIEGESHARKAVHIDPDCAASRDVLGGTLAAQRRFGEAETELRKALSLNPALVDSRGKLAYVLAETGRKTEAIEELQAALRTDPNNEVLRTYLEELTASK